MTASPPCSVNYPGYHAGTHTTRINHNRAHANREAHATRNIKEHAMHTGVPPRSGGAQGVDGRDNVRRSGAPGHHAHGNAARHVVDDCRAEVHG